MARTLCGVAIEPLVSLPGASKIFFDFEAIRGVYPLKERVRDSDIESSLVSAGGLVSPSQLRGFSVTKGIMDAGQQVDALRPEGYGRAAVVPMTGGEVFRTDGILVDVKGCGVRAGRTPLPEFKHNNGILLLNEALTELVWYRIVSHLAPFLGIETLPHFGLVNLGFLVSMPNLPAIPAVTILRAPHLRPRNSSPVPDASIARRMVKIEQALNSGGVSTSAPGFQIFGEYKNLRLRFYEWDQPASPEMVARFALSKDLPVPLHSYTPNVQLCDRTIWSEDSRCLVDFAHYKLFDEERGEIGVQRISDVPFNAGPVFRYGDSTVSDLDECRRLLGPVVGWGGLDNAAMKWLTAHDPTPFSRTHAAVWAMQQSHDYVHELVSGGELATRLENYAVDCVAALRRTFGPT